MAQRHLPHLPSRAKDHHIGIDRIPQQLGRQLGGIKQYQPIPQPRLKSQFQILGGDAEFGIKGELARDDLMRVHGRCRFACPHQPERFCPACNHQIAADDRIRLACGHADRADIRGVFGQPQMDRDSAALLGQPRHLDHTRTHAINLGGLCHHGADCDHACATHPCDHHIMGMGDFGQDGLGQIANIDLSGGILANFCALHRHKAGAKPFHAREILVATGLINRAFAAQFRLHRNNRDAIGLHPAIAAALANIGIDKDPLIDIGKAAPLAAAAFFGGAGLDIEDCRDPLFHLHLILHLGQIIALIARDAPWKGTPVDIFLGVIDDGDMGHPHRLEFMRDLAWL